MALRKPAKPEGDQRALPSALKLCWAAPREIHDLSIMWRPAGGDDEEQQNDEQMMISPEDAATRTERGGKKVLFRK